METGDDLSRKGNSHLGFGFSGLRLSKHKCANSRSSLVINSLKLSRPKRSTRVSMPLFRSKNLSASKRSQVTIFIILAIIIVAGVVIYFALRSSVKTELPKNMRPVYDYYLSCIKEHARQGASLLGEQAGYLYADEIDFVPGSQYMPFSSHLDFFGQPIPYWMYISGNNILKEQVPSKKNLEEQLEKYIEERLDYCDFSDYELQGFDVVVGEGDVDVNINNLNIEVNAQNSLGIYFENNSVFIDKHKVLLDSKLGKFYELALNVYNYEKKNMFLEKYALDVLRLYVPVTGVELTCSPKVFVDEEIRQELVQGLAANIGMLKLKGDYYELSSKENNYFVTDVGQNVDENINFIYSSSWPTKIEIYGDRVAQPVGLQEGFGILGFCYVPYHLIYDLAFPVMIQFYDSDEVFQFPVSVIIDKNNIRNALPTAEGQSIESEVCKYKNQDVSVYTYDVDLNPVEANIKFKCLNEECYIGRTKVRGGDAVLNAKMPKCANGFIVVSAEGYADAKYQISSNEESLANIVMNKLYNLSVNVNSGNVDYALVSFEYRINRRIL